MRATTNAALGAVGLATVLIIWELAAHTEKLAKLSIPPPSQIPVAFWSELNNGYWYKMMFASFSHYSIGLVVGSVLGVIIGILVALSPRVEAFQAWIARILRPIPPLAWIPFAIVWFGVSETAAAFIISIGIFWINYFAALSSVKCVDKDLIEVATAFGHRSHWARLRKVILPAASPGILNGLRTGLGQGWMTVIAAELFGIQGIGQRMIEASGMLNMDVVILYMLTIGALYGLTDFIFVRLQNRLLAWQK